MPNFIRDVSYDDYRTTVTTDVEVDVVFEEEFDISVEEFYDNMTGSEADEMRELLGISTQQAPIDLTLEAMAQRLSVADTNSIRGLPDDILETLANKILENIA
jgi:hypothetical protein